MHWISQHGQLYVQVVQTVQGALMTFSCAHVAYLCSPEQWLLDVKSRTAEGPPCPPTLCNTCTKPCTVLECAEDDSPCIAYRIASTHVAAAEAKHHLPPLPPPCSSPLAQHSTTLHVPISSVIVMLQAEHIVGKVSGPQDWCHPLDTCCLTKKHYRFSTSPLCMLSQFLLRHIVLAVPSTLTLSQ